MQSVRVLCLLVMLFTEMACRPADERKLAETHAIYLNQSLFREAAPAIAGIWGTRIELCSDVASIDNLWVDYAPRHKVSLQTALDEILRFIKIQHGVTLRWREIGDRILIEKQNERGAGDNGGQTR